MANNRMYIKCKYCGKYVCIAKHFGGEWNPHFALEENLGEFLEEHTWCGEKNTHGDFDIAYETDESDGGREI